MTEPMMNGLMATLFITHVGVYFATYGFERIELSIKIDKARLKLFYMRWAFSSSMIVGIFYLITIPMMNGGNILTLQKILGHSTILQTMTYAHLAPDYLNEAMKYKLVSTL